MISFLSQLISYCQIYVIFENLYENELLFLIKTHDKRIIIHSA